MSGSDDASLRHMPTGPEQPPPPAHGAAPPGAGKRTFMSEAGLAGLTPLKGGVVSGSAVDTESTHTHQVRRRLPLSAATHRSNRRNPAMPPSLAADGSNKSCTFSQPCDAELAWLLTWRYCSTTCRNHAIPNHLSASHSRMSTQCCYHANWSLQDALQHEIIPAISCPFVHRVSVRATLLLLPPPVHMNHRKDAAELPSYSSVDSHG